MADFTKIKDLLEKANGHSPSGFAIAFHIRLTSPDFLFQTYPKDWTDIYSEKGYVMVDPTVRWGFSETGHVRWSALSDLDDQNILEQSVAYGLGYGVTISTDTDNSRSFASFSRADREYSDDEIADLVECLQSLHKDTASDSGMGDDLRARLQDLSATMTKANTAKG